MELEFEKMEKELHVHTINLEKRRKEWMLKLFKLFIPKNMYVVFRHMF